MLTKPSIVSDSVASPAPGPSRTARAAVVLALFGGTALAFRWPGPIGNLSISRLGALLIVGLLVLSELRGGTPSVPRGTGPVVLAGMGLLVVNLLGLFHSRAFHIGVFQVGNLLELLTLLVGSLLLCRGLVHAERDVAARVAWLPLWGFLPSGLLGLYQAVELYRGRAPSIPFVTLSRADPAYSATRTAFNYGLNELGLDRVAGATGDPPTFGILCGLVFVYLLWLRRQSLSPPRTAEYLVFGVAGLGVVLSASASAALVTLTGVAFIVAPSRDRSRLLVRGGVATMLFAVAATQVRFIALFVESARLRIDPLLSGGGTADDHLELFRAAWGVFLRHPLVGAGAGSLGTLQYGYDVGYSSVHDAYLLQLAEAGLVGFGALAVFIVCLSRVVPRPLLASACAAFFVYLDINRLPFVWALLGVAAAVQFHLARPGPPARVGAANLG